ncbi:jacalin-like lectin [Umezawaea endophytica]|uniref:Jacalin-like lectin n=1 Tax=Umezawaea endophytica TaxID=1654476 RepID=A0A9X3AIM4_9PSEU|nr:jacalin-like lectin [Umezawaea endophytica]MCS7480705.1 jacalin-like lectin [Umezawaea endophytica]
MRPSGKLRGIGVPLLVAVAVSVLQPGPSAVAAPPVSGQFSLLTYNVAGLPEGLSSGHPAVNTPLISPRLAGYDVVNVQEDFNYHAALYAGDRHPHRTATSGGAGFGDGLNTLSNFPVSDFARHRWDTCNGTDCLTPKGFTSARVHLAEGVAVDLYNAHPNAGTTPADLAARRSNIAQLSRFVAANSAGNAVVVAGDTNTRYTRAEDNIRDLVRDNGLTDAWVGLVRDGVPPAAGDPALVCDPAAVTDACEVVDKVFYRGNALVQFDAVRYHNDNAAFLDAQGAPLSDHYPHTVDLRWRLADGLRVSDEFGGPHGTPFTDLPVVAGGADPSTVVLRGGSRLDAVGLGYADGRSTRHGGTGGTESAVRLADGERLVSATITRGKHQNRTRVFSVRLVTDRGTVVSAGAPTGDAVTYTAPPGWRIVGFAGRSGDEVDRLGVVFAP